jgi:hypothetical protein
MCAFSRKVPAPQASRPTDRNRGTKPVGYRLPGQQATSVGSKITSPLKSSWFQYAFSVSAEAREYAGFRVTKRAEALRMRARKCGKPEVTGLNARGAGCVRDFALVTGFCEYAGVVTASGRACANMRCLEGVRSGYARLEATLRGNMRCVCVCACVHPARCRVCANMRPPGLCALCIASARVCDVSRHNMDTSA